jgi:LysM repeat protein
VSKWTKSACLVIAWSIVLILAVVGSRGPRPAQANSGIANSTQETSSTQLTNPTRAVLTDAPGPLEVVTAAETVAAAETVTTGQAAAPAASWSVRPGDTLSAIAAALGVPGGWRALYAANRRLIGSNPDVIRAGTVLTLPGPVRPARYTVAAGDTLSGIAAGLAVPGGWPALYAANRGLIGSNPDVIRTGTVLVVTRPAKRPVPVAPRASGQGTGQASEQGSGDESGPGSTQAGSSASAGRHLSHTSTVPAGGTTITGGALTNGLMPSWLKVALLVAALLTTIAFVVEPVAVLVRRRRRGSVKAAGPPAPGRHPGDSDPAGNREGHRDRNGARSGHRDRDGDPSHGVSRDQCDRGECTAARAARIVQADYERLIVTYSVRDDTVYLLTPPGEDPRAVLRAARLVLPEDTYQELAGHLGVPSGWKVE